MEYRSKPIPASQPVIVSTSVYKDVERLDIRHWETPESGGDMYPTKAGVSVPLSMAEGLIEGILSQISAGADAKQVAAGEWNVVYAGRHVYKDKVYFDVRHWYLPEGKSKYVPTRKGISISLAAVPALVVALEEVRLLIQTIKPSETIDIPLNLSAGMGGSFANLETE